MISNTTYSYLCGCVCANSNTNLKTLFHKDCSSGSVKNLTTSPC